MKQPYAIASVPSLSGHAIAYRWRSLPRVHRHRASKPQGSSERVLPWQATMDQIICASLSHTHYWYEVGMLKAPAIGYAVLCKNQDTFWSSRILTNLGHILEERMDSNRTSMDVFSSAVTPPLMLWRSCPARLATVVSNSSLINLSSAGEHTFRSKFNPFWRKIAFNAE